MTDWWAIGISAILAIGLALLSWWNRLQGDGQKRLHDRLDDAMERLEKDGNRITGIEAEMRHLPSLEATARSAESMTKIAVDVAEIRGSQGVIEKLLSEILARK